MSTRWTEADIYADRLKKGQAKADNRAAIQAPDGKRDLCNEQMAAPKSNKLDQRFRVHVHSRRRRLADPGGISDKAAIDGITKAGIWPDDSAKFVSGVSSSQEISAVEETVIEIFEV